MTTTLPRTVRIAGWGQTQLCRRTDRATSSPASPVDLVRDALRGALSSAGGLELRDLGGLVAVPSLAEPHFMEAHYLATSLGLLPRSRIKVRTIDTGGAGPVSALLDASRMVKHENCPAVAVVAGDAVASLDSQTFLERADAAIRVPSRGGGDGAAEDDDGLNAPPPLASQDASPLIPAGYAHVTKWQMQRYGVSREQLGMVSVLMSMQASRHPGALTRAPHDLDDVLSAPEVAPNLGLLECARRADGAAALVVASSRFLESRGISPHGRPVVLGGSEASGPLYPPKDVTEDTFSCEVAAAECAG